jgi:hypothetical protein
MRKYKVGDTITFGYNRPMKWNKKGHMDKFLGKTVEIIYINYVGNKGDGTFRFRNDDAYWQFWLHEIEESNITTLKFEELEPETQEHVKQIINEIFGIKQTNINMNNQQRKQAIHDTANALCNAQNQFTNLELKNELRKNYPNEVWNQMDISIEMMDLADNEGHFNYTHNGSYRTYTATPSLQGSQAQTNSNPSMTAQLIAKAQSTNQPLKNQGKISTAPKIKPPVSTKRIGRNKALEIIQNTNGKFFSVKFVKKNGDERLMGVQYIKGTKADPLGYVRLKDLKTQITKSVNLQTLSEIKTNNTLYKVK